MTTNRFFSLTLIMLSAMGWMACSSAETREAYDKYYGKNRMDREAEAVVADSIAWAETRANRPVVATAAAFPAPSAEIATLLENNTCSVCHRPNERLIGPSFADIAKRNYTPEQMVELVHNPKPEHWPDYPPMAPLAHVAAEDIIKIAGWINSLK